MPSSTFLTFRTFSDEQFAKEFTVLLNDHAIEHVLESSGLINPLLTSAENNVQFYVKLRAEDFNKAHQALREFYAKQVEHAENDYYLFEFTQEELLEVIYHPNDWSDYDYALATKILKDNGISEIEHEVVLPEFQQKPEQLLTFTEAQFIKGCFEAAFGGFMGIVKGWWVLTDKKTLPNGEQYYAYGESDRKRGGKLFVVGGVLFFVYAVVSIYFIFKPR